MVWHEEQLLFELCSGFSDYRCEFVFKVLDKVSKFSWRRVVFVVDNLVIDRLGVRLTWRGLRSSGRSGSDGKFELGDDIGYHLF